MLTNKIMTKNEEKITKELLKRKYITIYVVQTICIIYFEIILDKPKKKKKLITAKENKNNNIKLHKNSFILKNNKFFFLKECSK